MKIILSLLLAVFTLTSFASAAPETKKASQKDEEIVAFLIVLNNNEIAAANKVSEKTVNKNVGSYARLMTKDHKQNLNETLKLSKKTQLQPLKTETVIALEQKGKDEIIVLSPLNNTAFEKAYIDAMVKGHAEALVVIDEKLKVVTNPALKKHLTATRTHVVHHLEKAQAIQKSLS